MKVLIDTNVILDAVCKREPFFDAAAKIFMLAAGEKVRTYIPSNIVTDIYYIARRNYMPEGEAREALRKLMKIVNVIIVGHNECTKALDMPLEDYEDALLAVCARRIKADCIVTRDVKHFQNSPVKPILPTQFLKSY